MNALSEVTGTSYAIGAGAYLLALMLVLANVARGQNRTLVLTACAVTSLWLVCAAADALLALPNAYLDVAASTLEQLRSLAWIAVAVFALSTTFYNKADKVVVVSCVGVVLSAAIYSIALSLSQLNDVALPELVWRGGHLANMAMAVIGLLVVENLFRNGGRETKWSIKYLCFGLGVVFSYDFFMYAQAALLGQVDEMANAARGVVQAIAVPLILISALRLTSRPRDLRLSRNFVFHSATLFAAGSYLVAVSAVGFWLRALNTPWGYVSQAIFLALAFLLLAVVLSSGEAQARLRNFINQNFFTYKYDYRTEWARFIDGISDSASDQAIPDRVLHALANLIGSTGGKIWIKEADENLFRAIASWNMAGIVNDVAASDPWMEAFAQCPDVIGLGGGASGSRNGSVANVPAWLSAHPQALIAVPLLHGQQFIGFVVLGALRSPRSFNWEDFQLLKIAARQGASYIAEHNATRALAEATRFQDFNRRFAFIVHDVKNLAAQMTLILRNAERHGDNPQFQKDILETVADSAERLRAMLEQLKDPSAISAPIDTVDLVSLLESVAAGWKLQNPDFRTHLPTGSVMVRAPASVLRAGVNHLIQNAFDAAGECGRIDLELQIEGGPVPGTPEKPDPYMRWAKITVSDDGPGMEASFVENQLFQPLQSAKARGFGIGAYQARLMARELGGRLDVESCAGRGTKVIVRLPCASVSNGEEQQDTAKYRENLLRNLKMG